MPQEDVDIRVQATDRASRVFRNISRRVNRLGRRLSDIGSRMSTFVTAPLLGAGAAAIKMASDAQEANNLFRKSLGDLTAEAEAFVDQWTEATKLDPITTKERLGTFNQMISNMGVATDRAFEMSKNLTTLTADLASFFNVQTERAFQRIQSGLSGEMEALRRWGIVVSQAKIEQVALREGLIETGEEMTQQEKIVARYMAIMNQTDMMQGDFIDTQDQLANTVRQLRAQFRVAARQMGRELVPIAEDVLDVLMRLVSAFAGLTEGQREMIITAAAVVAGLGPLLFIFGQLVTVWQAAIPVLQGLIATVTTGLAPAITSLLATLTGVGGVIALFGVAYAAIDKFTGGASGAAKETKQLKENTDRLKDSLGSLGQAAREELLTSARLQLGRIRAQAEQLRNRADPTEAIAGGRLGLGLQRRVDDEALEERRKEIEELEIQAGHLENRIRVLMEIVNQGASGAADAAEGAATSVMDVFRGPIEFQRTLQEELERTKSLLRETLRLESRFATPAGGGMTTSQRVDQFLGRTQPGGVTDPTAGGEGLPFGEKIKNTREIAERNLELAGQALEDFEARAARSGQRISEAVQTALIDSIATLGQELGKIFSGATGAFQSFSDKLVGILGALLQTIGKALIAFGVAGEAIQKFIVDPTTAIIAGASLVALGSALSQSVAQSVDSAGSAVAGGAGTAAGGATGTTPQDATRGFPPNQPFDAVETSIQLEGSREAQAAMKGLVRGVSVQLKNEGFQFADGPQPR